MTSLLIDTPDPQGNPCGCRKDKNLEQSLLQCLERPKFYFGQHLTDSDLSAIVDYLRQRLARVRLRNGWGVVAGLGVGADLALLRQTIVRVGSGYAVDSCGNDLVVCEELRVPLKDLEVDWDKVQFTKELYTGSPAKFAFLDLFLVPKDVPTHHRLAKTQGRCDSSCSPSRFREETSLELREPPPETNAGKAETPTQRAKKAIHTAFDKIPTNPGTSKIDSTVLAEWLKKWNSEADPSKDQYALRRRGYVFAWLDSVTDVDNDLRDRIKSELISDALEQIRERFDGKCRPNAGAPLARIWFKRPNCGLPTIYWIDERPPPDGVRRPFGPDDPPKDDPDWKPVDRNPPPPKPDVDPSPAPQVGTPPAPPTTAPPVAGGAEAPYVPSFSRRKRAK